MADEFAFDPKFFDWMGQQPGVKAVTREAAEAVAERARSTAPVDSGGYRDSIGVEESPRDGRVTYRVIADVEHGLAVEARTGNLARAAKAVRK